MGAATAAGARLYIGTTAADAATDTYIEIGEVIEIGAFGRVYNQVTHTPLASRGVQKLKGSFNDGDPVVQLAKDINDDGQAAVLAALPIDADYNFKVVDNDDVPVKSSTVTISVASPGVVTWTAHDLAANSPVVFSTTGVLPAGLTAGTTYYVKTVLSANTFTVSATAGGSAINTTASPAASGVHTATTEPVGTSQTFKAQVMGFQDGTRTSEGILSKSLTLGIKSGSITETVHLP
jgi:hypothetical protein